MDLDLCILIRLVELAKSYYSGALRVRIAAFNSRGLTILTLDRTVGMPVCSMVSLHKYILELGLIHFKGLYWTLYCSVEAGLWSLEWAFRLDLCTVSYGLIGKPPRAL